MITLYAVSGACSLAPHIVLEEFKLPYQLKLFQWENVKALREELKPFNPMGQVPTIITDEGYPLAEVAAILQYLSHKSGKGFPTAGKERFKALEWLNFVATEVHKSFLPSFNPRVFSDNETHFETIKRVGIKRIERILKIAEVRFPETAYVLGNEFGVVDAYLFAVLNWCGHFAIDLSPYPKLSGFVERMRGRTAVVAAIQQEGLG